eukprot:COSAG02_NODE_20267_length_840_cov_1.232119_1_plen_91_part_10
MRLRPRERRPARRCCCAAAAAPAVRVALAAMQNAHGGGDGGAWPADFALRQERGASELVMSGGEMGSSARLMSLSECWDDFFLALAESDPH